MLTLFALSVALASPPDLAPFEAAPADWIAYVGADADPDDPVDLVLWNLHTTIHEDGSREQTFHTVYRVDRRADATGWDAVSWSWSPWIEDRPVIRARVIHPDGTARELDPASLVEQGPPEKDKLWSDRRSLSGPLPQVVDGALIEEVATLVQHQPPLGPGASAHTRLAWNHHDVRLVRYQIDTYGPRPLQITTAHLDVPTRPRRTKEGWTWKAEVRDVAKVPGWAARVNIIWPVPSIYASTWRDWAEVASTYHAAVEPMIDPTGLEDLVAEVRAAPDVDEAARRAVRGVQQRLRYTGMELGANSLIPYLPKLCVDRGFGDCKDQSTAVVAVLRAAGHPASLALVRTGTVPSPPGLPDLTRFDHAIVHVPGATRPWIDPTSDDRRVGDLAASVMGRPALLIAPGTTALSTTPVQPSTYVEERTVRWSGLGAPSVHERSAATGLAERSVRSDYVGFTPTKISELLTSYAGKVYGATGITDLRQTGTTPDDETWSLEFTADAQEDWRSLEAGVAHVDTGQILNVLPASDGALAKAKAAKDLPPDLTWNLFPLRYETVWRVELPPGWRPTDAPSPFEVTRPGVSAWRRVETTPDAVIVRYGAETTGVPVRLDHLREVHSAILAALGTPPSNVQIAPAALGERPAEALRAAAARAAAPSASVEDHAALAVALRVNGWPDEARSRCARLAQDHPTDRVAAACVFATHGVSGAPAADAAPEAVQLASLAVLLREAPGMWAAGSSIALAAIARANAEGDADPAAQALFAALRGLPDDALTDTWATRALLDLHEGRAADVVQTPPPAQDVAHLSVWVAALAMVGRVDEAAAALTAAPSAWRAEAVKEARVRLSQLRAWDAQRALLPRVIDLEPDAAKARAIATALSPVVRVDALPRKLSVTQAAQLAILQAAAGATEDEVNATWAPQPLRRWPRPSSASRPREAANGPGPCSETSRSTPPRSSRRSTRTGGGSTSRG